jgi:hypothetical protein
MDLRSMKEKPKQPDWTPRDPVEPEALWRGKAESLVFKASEQLMANDAQMRWLAGRGIGEKSVAKFWLGWLPDDIYQSRESWGLSSVKNEESGKERPLWLPAGLVIPWMSGSDLVKLRIRRPDPIRFGPRYYMVPGSASATTLIRPIVGERIVRREVYVIVESELDAIMIHDQAGDVCGAVALGSNSAHPDIDASRTLAGAAVILNALDFDAAGSSERKWWEKHFHQSRRWPAPRAKDPGDAYKVGINIREWIKAGLPEGMRTAA